MSKTVNQIIYGIYFHLRFKANHYIHYTLHYTLHYTYKYYVLHSSKSKKKLQTHKLLFKKL